MDQQFEQLLGRMTEYADIPKSQLERLSGMMQFQTVNKNTYFIRMEDEAEKFAYITKGVFRVFCVSEEGTEKTLAFRSEGQFIAPYTPVSLSRLKSKKRLSSYHRIITRSFFYVIFLLDKQLRERILYEKSICNRWQRIFRNQFGSGVD